LDHDFSLLERIRKGEREAFGLIVEKYQALLFNLALRWTRSKEDAEDIVQKAFLNAYEKIGTFRGQSSLKTWLFRIALNLLKNEVRFRKTRAIEELDDSIPSSDESPLQQSMNKQETGRVLKAIDRLKPKQKATLLLRIAQEFSFEEIAQTMKCTQNTAKVNFHYAVRNLHDLLAKEGFFNEMPIE